MKRSWKYLETDLDEAGVLLLKLNRPDKLNVLSTPLMDELDELFTSLEAGGEVNGVILTGAGEKAFAAGADIAELNRLDREGGEERARKGQALCLRLESFSAPVIAAINGYALGGGAELAMACHLRVAAGEAEIGLPETGLGVLPGFGGTQRLTRLVGPARALDLILTGRRVKADEALSMGLVNRVVPAGELITATRKLLGRMLENGPLAISASIRAVAAAGSQGGYEREAELFGELCGTEDFLEGTRAFLEKRRPLFRGR